MAGPGHRRISLVFDTRVLLCRYKEGKDGHGDQPPGLYPTAPGPTNIRMLADTGYAGPKHAYTHTFQARERRGGEPGRVFPLRPSVMRQSQTCRSSSNFRSVSEYLCR